MTHDNRLSSTTGFLLAATIIAGCGDAPVQPAVPELPTTRAFSTSSPGIDPAGCATDPDAIVTAQTEIFSALEEAGEGDVIAVEGLVAMDQGFVVTTAGLTLTCASPGSGLVASNDFRSAVMIWVAAPRVRLTRLVMKVPDVPHGIYAPGTTARELEVSGIDITCGPGTCVFLAGVPVATITDNTLLAEANVSGFHVQGLRDAEGNLISETDDTRIIGNTVVTAAPSTSPVFGGIRIRQGHNVVVSDNDVAGPWANSIAATEITGSVIEGNRLEGAVRFGLGLSFFPFREIGITGTLFRRNEVANAGTAAVRVAHACGNAFLGNALESGVDATIVFTETTGGNDVFGPVESVIDDGSLDCDGDGAADPNVVPSAGLVTAGADVGETIQGTMQDVAGIRVR